MDYPTRRRLATLAAFAVWISLMGICVGAEDADILFRMDSRVTNDVGDLLARTTTLFTPDAAYDILHGKPAKIAKFHYSRQAVVLLDRRRRLATEISFADLLKFQSQLERRARRRGFSDFGNPSSLVLEHDAMSSVIRVKGPWLTYEADMSEDAPEHARAITQFANWSARIACMLSPTAPPPTSRLALNQALMEQNRWATSVRRIGGPQKRIRSHHELAEGSSPRDQSLAQGIEKDVKEFRRVLLSDYLGDQISPQSLTKK